MIPLSQSVMHLMDRQDAVETLGSGPIDVGGAI